MDFNHFIILGKFPFGFLWFLEFKILENRIESAPFEVAPLYDLRAD